MEPILIPSVPKEAFNKHRLISDLVRKQVEHFKHVEDKLSEDVRMKLPQDAVTTEDEAARYIGAMTTYLLSRPRPNRSQRKPLRSSLPLRYAPVRQLRLQLPLLPHRRNRRQREKLPNQKVLSKTNKMKLSPALTALLFLAALQVSAQNENRVHRDFRVEGEISEGLR